MKFLSELTHNKVLICPLIAWLIAQLLKVPFSFSRETGLDFQRFVSSGGMPSAHSALVTALATITGLVEGWSSPLFGVTMTIATIVMYDAAGVRQSTGMQAQILNQMLAEWKQSKRFRNVRVRELLGHSPNEVFAGALLGIVTAAVYFVV